MNNPNYYHRALKIFEELPTRCNLPDAIQNSKSGMCSCFANIGNIHLALSNYSVAKEYFQKTLKITEESVDKNGLSLDYINMGNVNYYQGKYDEALKYYKKAAKTYGINGKS